MTNTRGVVTYRGLPASANVFVLADPKDGQTIEILDLNDDRHRDVLDTFDEPGANDMGAFGPEGGFHHTVERCPLQSADHNQDGSACGSFAFVSTYQVFGHVNKAVVEMDDVDDFENVKTVQAPGIWLALHPVTNKNLQMDDASVAISASNSNATGWDDRDFVGLGRLATGVYTVSVPEGWSAIHHGDATTQIRLDSLAPVPEDELDEPEEGKSPPAKDSVHFDVRPATGTLYGIILDEDGDPVDAKVTVNGVSVETDIDGRYIVEGYGSRASRVRNALYITVEAEGYKTQTDNPGHVATSRRFQITNQADGGRPSFAANVPMRLDVDVAEQDKLATVTGTVTDKNGDPVSGVEIGVTLGDVSKLANAARGCTNCVKTVADGTYTLQVMVTDDDAEYTITPSMRQKYFDNLYEEERLETGDEVDGVDFVALDQGRIRGYVRDGSGDRMADVTITAEARSGDYNAAPVETNSNGRFSLWVNGDEKYDVMAKKTNYTFTLPEDAVGGVSVDDGETREIGFFTAVTTGAGSVEGTRDKDGSVTAGSHYNGALTITWEKGNVPTGEIVTYQAQTVDYTDATWEKFDDRRLRRMPQDDLQMATGGHRCPTRAKFAIRIMVRLPTREPVSDGTDDVTVAPVTEVDAVTPDGFRVSAGVGSVRPADEVDITWNAKNTLDSSFRIVFEVAGNDGTVS